jgi:hypothetical protein
MYISTTILGKKMFRASDGNLRARPTDCHITTQIGLSISLRLQQSILLAQFTLVWIVFFCIMTPCCVVCGYHSFGETFCLNLQGAHNPGLQCREN